MLKDIVKKYKEVLFNCVIMLLNKLLLINVDLGVFRVLLV